MERPMEPARGPSSLVLTVLVLAAVIGVVSVVLVGSTPAGPTPRAGELNLNFPPVVWGLLFLSPLIVGLGGLLLRRFFVGAWRPRGKGLILVVGALLVFLVLMTLLLLSAHTTSGGSVSVSGSGGNTPPSGGSGSGSGSGGSPAPANIVSFQVPFWAVIALVFGFTIVVGVFALPGVLGRVLDRVSRRGRPVGGGDPVDPKQVQVAIAEASQALVRGDDPRQTIVHLYVRLLNEFGPKLGEVEYMTAEEIRGEPLARLHVSPSAAEALTRLFEQARYSTHRLGPADAGRCLDALRTVEADLGRPARVA